jgi:hypothetical protein
MKRNHLEMVVHTTAMLFLIGWLAGCAPVFSELQSARTVGKNRFEVTPAYSAAYASFKDEDINGDKVQSHIGVRANYGLTSRLDIGLRFERIWPTEAELDEGVSIIGVSAKMALLENRVAVSLPLGRGLGEDSKESWQLHPTLLLTLPAVPDKVDITLAPKYLLTFCEDCEDLFAVNIGLALSNDLNKWAIRPEYGLLYNPGEKGHYSQFSLGITFALGN